MRAAPMTSRTMHQRLAVLAATAALGFAVGPAATTRGASVGEVPVRKSGQWKITTIAPTLGMTTIDACIGPGDCIAATTSPGQCSAPEVERAGDQVIISVTCTTPKGRERTSTLFTGDFTTWYRGIVKMTFDPPVDGRANLGVTLDARYAGPCP